MANAKKCDRCGKYYDKNIGERCIDGSFVTQIHIRTKGPYEVLDLCDHCINKLYEYLENPER